MSISRGSRESGIFLESRNGKTNVALQFRNCTVKYWTVLCTAQHCTVQSWALSRTDYSTAQYSRWCYVAKSLRGGRGGPMSRFLEFSFFLGFFHPSLYLSHSRSYDSNRIQSPITRENSWPADSLNNNNYFFYNLIIPFHWVLDCS